MLEQCSAASGASRRAVRIVRMGFMVVLSIKLKSTSVAAPIGFL